ncbi:MAG: hypothetical protein A2958_01035 [Candidatus Levybacteria bacterium RIFCSPLOWO2_01_FULL_38_13]|nr:MAG: hypothetical protein A2629_00930 [Candidatus Levybacteria bacterium RIFCSPHIGHO2_01_FULL_41_15]OGH34872.1 MAG: hypothetical protein A2958_01035 [Candidatus Levybacteria bacterium RIFCSPLOWO2_01_FULL_38_13]
MSKTAHFSKEIFLEAVKFLSKFPRISSTLFILLFFALVSFSTGDQKIEKSIKAASESKVDVPEFKIIPTPTPALIPTPIPTRTPNSFLPTPIAPPILGKEENNNQPSSSSDLLNSVNAFRRSNGISELLSSGTLCSISQSRLSELISLGSLDNHAGFDKYFKSQSEFKSMGEVTFSSSDQRTPDYVVNEGWAKSTAGHRENILNSKWQYGCGTMNSYFSVFNLASK